MQVLIDYETRSCCDLKKAGAYVYARHPSTELLCLAYTADGQDIKLWHPGLPEPEDLFAWIKQGAEMHAWNSYFERVITKYVATRMGWPDVPDDQWRCTQAKAASYGLPKKLEKAAAALGTKHQKDMSGHRTMLRYSKPRKPTKNNPSIWWDDPEKLEQIYEYCRDDVRTEYEISSVLKDLSPSELAVWRRSEQINLRGVAVDPELATKAIALGVPAKQSANEEIARLTGNAVQDTGARDALKTWLKAQGVTVPLKFDKKTKTDKETTGAKMLEKLLKSGAIKDPLAQRVVQVWIKANKSSVAKYASILEHAGQEGRVREAFVYHGALTGRFSGRGIQPQNFPRPPEGLENTDQVCQDILDCEYEELSMLYGPDQIMGVLSAGLRGALVAGPGLILQSADFSSIEARGAAWFAGDKALLTIFRQLDAEPDADWDLYTWQASRLLNEKVTKKDKIKRQNWGKVPSLACFYQASGKAVVRFADEQLGVTLDPKVADEVVAGWRADRKPIVKCWRACEDAAVEAVRRQHLKERVVVQGPVKWGVVGRFLKCRLPSGRTISYLDPKIESVTVQYTRNGEKKQFTKDTVTFMGQDQFTRKWKRLALYGGRYFENIVSGMCRDLLTAAMERVEDAGYPVVLHAHDELACEVQPNFGSNKEFVRLMSIKPDWAGNFPIAVSGEWRGRRYRK